MPILLIVDRAWTDDDACEAIGLHAFAAGSCGTSLVEGYHAYERAIHDCRRTLDFARVMAEVERLQRAALVEHGVSRAGAERIGRHYPALKEFAGALARFGSVVGTGSPEQRRGGHRELLKACAYARAVKTWRR